MRRLACTLAAALIVCPAGCGQTKKKRADPRDAKERAVSADSGQTKADTVEVDWTAVKLAGIGVRAEFVSGPSIEELKAEPGKRVGQSNGAFSIGLRRGEDADRSSWLTSLRMGGSVKVVSDAKATLCGKSGHRQEASIGPHEGGGARTGPDGELEYSDATGPRRVSVAIEVDVSGEPLLAWFVVDADKRDAHAAIESHFFAAIECL